MPREFGWEPHRAKEPELLAMMAYVLGEAGLAHPFLGEAFEVDLRADELRLDAEAMGFGEQGVIFAHQSLAIPSDMGRRFARAGAALKVSRHASSRLVRHQIAAILGLGNGDGRARRV